MVLHTAPSCELGAIEAKLLSLDIAYTIQPVTKSKINVFFGDAVCIEIIRSFNMGCLSGLTHEQDFILGTLLGYDLRIQCRRYLTRVAESESIQKTHKEEQIPADKEPFVYA